MKKMANLKHQQMATICELTGMLRSVDGSRIWINLVKFDEEDQVEKLSEPHSQPLYNDDEDEDYDLMASTTIMSIEKLVGDKLWVTIEGENSKKSTGRIPLKTASFHSKEDPN